MNYNNRGYSSFDRSGCSIFGLLATMIIIGLVIRGGMYFLFKNFWLIVVLGVVIWAFRKFVNPTNKSSNNTKSQGNRQNWNRDYENRKDTAYHNVDRDFEEVDDDDDDEFSDF